MYVCHTIYEIFSDKEWPMPRNDFADKRLFTTLAVA